MPNASETVWKIFIWHITDITRDTHNALSRLELTFCVSMQTNIYVTADSAMLHLLMNPSERQSSRLLLLECCFWTRASLIGDQAQIPIFRHGPKGTVGHLQAFCQLSIPVASATDHQDFPYPCWPAVPPPHSSLIHWYSRQECGGKDWKDILTKGIPLNQETSFHKYLSMMGILQWMLSRCLTHSSETFWTQGFCGERRTKKFNYSA